MKEIYNDDDRNQMKSIFFCRLAGKKGKSQRTHNAQRCAKNNPPHAPVWATGANCPSAKVSQHLSAWVFLWVLKFLIWVSRCPCVWIQGWGCHAWALSVMDWGCSWLAGLCLCWCESPVWCWPNAELLVTCRINDCSAMNQTSTLDWKRYRR